MEHIVYCYRSGEIGVCEVGREPEGTIEVLRHSDLGKLIAVIDVKARHGYDGKLLVPGVPEAEAADDALEALIAWRDWALEGI